MASPLPVAPRRRTRGPKESKEPKQSMEPKESKGSKGSRPSSVHPSRGQPSRARNAAVLTRFWHDVEQYRRVPLREVST